MSLSEEELHFLKCVLIHNRINGNSYFSNEVKKSVYLMDQDMHDELIRIESKVFTEIVGDSDGVSRRIGKRE